MKKEKDGTVQPDENLPAEETKKKKRLLISIRDLTTEEAANVTGGAPPVTNGSTYMCCW